MTPSFAMPHLGPADRHEFEIRRAEQKDAAEIARLFLISSDGLAAYIWRRLAQDGTPLEAVGAARYSRTGTAFSYQNCLLATRGGTVTGMAHAFEMSEAGGEDPETDPVLAPYAALEDPGSLYISGLAVHAPFRSRGIGAALLDCVEALAFTRAIPRLSLICFERNTRAIDFYQRLGFRVADRRPVVPHPDLHYSDGNAFLMTRTVGGVRADGLSVPRGAVADPQAGSVASQAQN